MLEGLFAAASGMEAQQAQMDAVSNDIANLDTTGYQSEQVGFRDLLYSSGGAANDMSAATGAGASATVIGRSSAQGDVQQTGRPLDVALVGQGYLAVTEPGGTIGLTRNGALQLSASGQLTTSDGMPLSPPVVVPPGTDANAVKIASDGTVTVAGRKLGQIRVVTVPAPDGLQAQGSSLYATTAASGAPRTATATQLKQGALEGSNVDIAQSMSTLIQAQQSYALSSKAIDFQNQMLQIANGVKR